MIPADKTFWKGIGNQLLSLAKNQLIKAAVNKLVTVGSRFAGIKAWLVKMGVELFWDHVAEPIARYAVRKGLLGYDKIQGKIQVKRLSEARESGNAEDYDDATDGIFN